MHEKLEMDLYYSKLKKNKDKISEDLEKNYYQTVISTGNDKKKVCRYCGIVVDEINIEEEQFKTFGVKINNAEQNQTENYIIEILLTIERQDLDTKFINEIIKNNINKNIFLLKSNNDNFNNQNWTPIGNVKKK